MAISENTKKNIALIMAIAVVFCFSPFFVPAENANADAVLNVSCSVNPSTAYEGDIVTWSAVATGGNGTFTYSWSGNDSLSGSTSTVSKTYDSPGIKVATVLVTSGAQSKTKNCSTTVLSTLSDVIAPTVPAITSASATGTIITQANISWSNSVDAETGLAGYLTLWNSSTSTQIMGGTPGVSSTTSTTTSTSASGTYYFHVAAIDNAGNISTTTTAGPFVVSDSAVLIVTSTIGGNYYDIYSPTVAESVLASTTGTTTIINSDVTTWWDINNSVLNNTDFDNSISDNSSLTNCYIINSTVIDFTGVDCSIVDSYIDPSSSISGEATSSVVLNSTFDYSRLFHAYVSSSTITYSDINYSTTTNSIISSSTVNYSIINNGYIILSDIDNSNITNSTSTNSIIATSTVVNSTIDASEVYTSNIFDSDITDAYIENSTVVNSSFNDVTSLSSYIATSTLTNTVIYNSTSTNSEISNSAISAGSVIDNSVVILSDISNSTVVNSTSTNSTIATSTVDSSVISSSTIILSDIDNSNITDSIITSSTVASSTVDNSTVTDSTVASSSISDSIIDNSTITNSDVSSSTITDSTVSTSTITDSVIASSTITDSTITNSTTTNSTISSSTITEAILIDAVVIDNIISTGTITVNGTTTVISTSTPLNTLVNFIPTASFIVSTNYLQVDITDTTTDANEGTSFVDSWTYDWNFGDGATSTISTTTTDGSISYTYATAGTYGISLLVTDSYGATSTATTSVTVVYVPPAVTLTSIAITTPADVLTYNVGDTLDITGLVVTGTYSDSSTSTEAITLGNISGFDSSATTTGQVLTITVGTATTTYTIDITDAPIIPDTTAPVITILGSNPETVVLGDVYVDAGATALDDVDGSVTVSATGTVDTNTIGSYEIIYTATDSSLNTATSTRTVNVVATPDTTAPVITINGSNPVNVILGGAYSDDGATALDDVDGDITSSIVTTGLPIDTSATGTQFVTYSVSDGAGNSTSSVRTINIIGVPTDTVAPAITILGGSPVTVAMNSTYTDAGATALDAVDGDLTSSLITTGLPIDTSATGTFSVIYSATDAAGNTGTATRTVNVIEASADITPPVITITGGTPTTVLASSTYTDEGATALDDIDGDVTASTTSNDVDTNIIGVYSVVYSASDSSGNTSTATRTVNVVEATSTDIIPPVIFVTGGTPITITEGSTYVDQGATATDDVDGDVTANIIVTNTVDANTVGSYTVTYTVSDIALNTSVAIRDVNVIPAPVDVTAPAITILGGSPVTVAMNSTYTDAGATALDAVDGDLTSSLITTGLPIDTSATGTFSVIYSATDAAGNTGTATRTVIVIQDTIAPALTILGANPQDVVLTLPYVEAGAVAIDDLDGDITSNIVITGNVDTDTIGTYIVTYSIADSSGNSASSTRTVNVIADTVAPVITILGSNPETVLVGDTYSDDGATALDNVDGVVTVTATGTVDTNIVGSYTITYTATDSSLNTATSTRTANVVSSLITLVNITITTPANVLTYDVGDALDISGLIVTGTYSDGSTTTEAITLGNISGFDSSAPANNQVLTITVGSAITTYTVDINASSGGGGGSSNVTGSYAYPYVFVNESNSTTTSTSTATSSSPVVADLPVYLFDYGVDQIDQVDELIDESLDDESTTTSEIINVDSEVEFADQVTIGNKMLSNVAAVGEIIISSGYIWPVIVLIFLGGLYMFLSFKKDDDEEIK